MQLDVNSTRYENGFRFLIDAIPAGFINAVSLNAISEHTGRTVSEVKKKISEARLEGYVIIGDETNGYHTPDTPAEVREYIRQRERDRQELHKILVDIVQFVRRCNSLEGIL